MSHGKVVSAFERVDSLKREKKRKFWSGWLINELECYLFECARFRQSAQLIYGSEFLDSSHVFVPVCAEKGTWLPGSDINAHTHRKEKIALYQKCCANAI